MNDLYRSKPVKRAKIPKRGSRKKKRVLGIPTIRDRVCQQAVLNVLQPIFEEYFHASSHGFRPGHSTRTAAKEVERLRRNGYRFVADVDIEDFFDQVNHEILMRLVRQVVKDRRVLGLIRGWLKAGVMEEGNIRYQTSGTPQGGVISPLLSNVYLTVLDRALEEAGYRFVRYADDIVCLCRSKEEAERALEYIRRVLRKLKLELNEEKSGITSFKEGPDFLGYRFGPRGRGVGSNSLRAFYAKVREVTHRNQGDIPVGKVIDNLNPVIRGWGNYHREGRNVGLFAKLDVWVRNRLRGYVSKRWQIHHRLNVIMTNKELTQLGLLSLHGVIRPDSRQLKLL
jgi:group II intron reverse transcriptase/maturase